MTDKYQVNDNLPQHIANKSVTSSLSQVEGKAKMQGTTVHKEYSFDSTENTFSQSRTETARKIKQLEQSSLEDTGRFQHLKTQFSRFGDIDWKMAAVQTDDVAVLLLIKETREIGRHAKGNA